LVSGSGETRENMDVCKESFFIHPPAPEKSNYLSVLRHCAAQFVPGRSKGKERADHEVDRYGRVAALHFCNAGLAGTDDPGKFFLRQVPGLPFFLQIPGERDFQFDIRGLFLRKAQKIRCVPGFPSMFPKFEKFLFFYETLPC
jgi:hypothetical protein